MTPKGRVSNFTLTISFSDIDDNSVGPMRCSILADQLDLLMSDTEAFVSDDDFKKN